MTPARDRAEAMQSEAAKLAEEWPRHMDNFIEAMRECPTRDMADLLITTGAKIAAAIRALPLPAPEAVGLQRPHEHHSRCPWWCGRDPNTGELRPALSGPAEAERAQRVHRLAMTDVIECLWVRTSADAGVFRQSLAAAEQEIARLKETLWWAVLQTSMAAAEFFSHEIDGLSTFEQIEMAQKIELMASATLEFDGSYAATLAAAEQEIARLREEASDAVAKYARTVDDPARAHLHYDGCPYKPYAEMARWEEPDNAPACTCAEEHLGAYWKGQNLLERGYHDLTKKKLEAIERDVAILKHEQQAAEQRVRALEAALRAAHHVTCATVRPDGACGGCYVSAALAPPEGDAR